MIYAYIWRVHRRVLSERVRVSDLTLCFPSGLSLLTHVLLYIYIITLSERIKYNTAQTASVLYRNRLFAMRRCILDRFDYICI